MAPGLKYVTGDRSQGQLHSYADPQLPFLCAWSALKGITGSAGRMDKFPKHSQGLWSPAPGLRQRNESKAMGLPSYPFFPVVSFTVQQRLLPGVAYGEEIKTLMSPSPFTPLSSDMGLWTLQRWGSSGKEHMVKKGKEESLARSGGCHPKAISLNQSLLGIYYGILLILKITTESMTTFVRRVWGGRRDTVKL